MTQNTFFEELFTTYTLYKFLNSYSTGDIVKIKKLINSNKTTKNLGVFHLFGSYDLLFIDEKKRFQDLNKGWAYQSGSIPYKDFEISDIHKFAGFTFRGGLLLLINMTL